MTIKVKRKQYEIEFEIQIKVVGSYDSAERLHFKLDEQVPVGIGAYTHLKNRLEEEVTRNRESNYFATEDEAGG